MRPPTRPTVPRPTEAPTQHALAAKDFPKVLARIIAQRYLDEEPWWMEEGRVVAPARLGPYDRLCLAGWRLRHWTALQMHRAERIVDPYTRHCDD